MVKAETIVQSEAVDLFLSLSLSLSLRPKMQRQGVGSALLEESVKVARRQGYKAIQVRSE